MSRVTRSCTRAQLQYLTPIDELSSQERRTRATALDITLSSLRPTTDSFDEFRSFTSRCNHAPPSALHKGQGMSANAPREQSSHMACIVEVHPTPQLADEDNDPTMDRDLVAPAGGLPGDDGPSGDPGDDDPNDPFNDDKDDDDEVEDQLNQLDPGLIVFSNLAGAINVLTRNAQRNSESSSSRTRVREPDTFDGANPKKLCAFLVQCKLNFQDRQRAFNADRAKVTFVQSYLKGMALEWFKPNLLGTLDAYDRPLWIDDWCEFVTELQLQFGPHDPIRDTEHQLDNLRMKDTQRIICYIVEFNCLASQLKGYGNTALRHKFYTSLPNCIKDEICHVGKPQQLEDLRSLTQSINAHYWERKEEVARQTKTSPRNSSNNGNNNASNKSDKKTLSSGNSPQPANLPSSSKGKNTSKPDIAEKLSKDGKLTPDERKQRINNGLCMFCGAAGHLAKECPKSTLRAAKACAVAAETLEAKLMALTEAKK